MAKVTVLGSANAIPDLAHDNTHLLIQDGDTHILVDCSSSPVQRLEKIGIKLDQLNDIIFTHFHPDHVAGAPLFFMVMWLQGRRKTLHLHGLEYTLSRIHQNMQLYGYESWPNFYAMRYHTIASQARQLVFKNANLRITSSPVNHLIPTLGLKVDFLQSNKSLVYSCDTEPCDAVIDLAQGADVLLHEAAGEIRGHTSPEQAAEVAKKAGVKNLYLIHYDYKHPDLAGMLDEG